MDFAQFIIGNVQPTFLDLEEAKLLKKTRSQEKRII